MHEFSITEHLLEYCMEEARRQNVSKIRTINVCIGQLRGIIPDCIQVYLDMLSEGTIAEGAKLKAKLLPVKVRCLECGREGEMIPGRLECPFCGSLKLKLLSGKEFYIESLEVDENGNQSAASDHGLE